MAAVIRHKINVFEKQKVDDPGKLCLDVRQVRKNQEEYKEHENKNLKVNSDNLLKIQRYRLHDGSN